MLASLLRPEPINPQAPCSRVMYTWALERLPCHCFGLDLCTIKLHEPFGKEI